MVEERYALAAWLPHLAAWLPQSAAKNLRAGQSIYTGSRVLSVRFGKVENRDALAAWVPHLAAWLPPSAAEHLKAGRVPSVKAVGIILAIEQRIEKQEEYVEK